MSEGVLCRDEVGTHTTALTTPRSAYFLNIWWIWVSVKVDAIGLSLSSVYMFYVSQLGTTCVIFMGSRAGRGSEDDLVADMFKKFGLMRYILEIEVD